jgi:peptidoglycan/LPS O-acetylase OafA/YrhL
MRENQNNYDALRLIGALLVLVNHSLVLCLAQPLAVLGQSISTLGVKLFFAISGYLIATSWMRDPHPGRFVLRRARRILPALCVVVVLSVAVIGPIFTTLDLRTYATHPFILRYLGNIVFYVSYSLPGVFADNPYPHAVNGSLWTLPVEIAMYALVPLLVFAARRHALLIALLFAAAVGLSMFFLIGRPAPWVVAGTEFWTAANLAPYFVGGAALAGLRLERLLDWRVAVALLALFHFVHPIFGIWHEAVFALLLPYAAIAIGRARWPVVARAGRYGDFSYGIYLWSFPIQQIVAALAVGQISGWGNVAWTVPAAFTMAILSWHLVEKHALSRRRSATLPAPNQRAVEA